VLDRAGTLGLADNGRPSSLARAWVTDGDDGLYRAAEALCPPPVEQVIIQNDRTIIAPGPLPARAAGLISAIATLEQPGVACVWRISETSIDHALAAGHAGEDLLDRLAELSAGPLPDTVTVAVTDALARAAAAGPAAAGPAHHAAERLTIHRPTTHRPVTRRFPDGEAILDPATAAGWVDALRLRQRRDGASHPADSTHSGMRSAFDLQITDTMDRAQSTGEEITGATLIVAELTRAVHKKQRVALEFVDRRGITSRAELVPEKVAAGAVTGTTADGTAVSYLLYRICSITRYTD
ncbi:helicase-associated domain-containing protein, partial [Corynebacterium sp. CCM 8862]